MSTLPPPPTEVTNQDGTPYTFQDLCRDVVTLAMNDQAIGDAINNAIGPSVLDLQKRVDVLEKVLMQLFLAAQGQMQGKAAETAAPQPPPGQYL